MATAALPGTEFTLPINNQGSLLSISDELLQQIRKNHTGEGSYCLLKQSTESINSMNDFYEDNGSQNSSLLSYHDDELQCLDSDRLDDFYGNTDASNLASPSRNSFIDEEDYNLYPKAEDISAVEELHDSDNNDDVISDCVSGFCEDLFPTPNSKLRHNPQNQSINSFNVQEDESCNNHAYIVSKNHDSSFQSRFFADRNISSKSRKTSKLLDSNSSGSKCTKTTILANESACRDDNLLDMTTKNSLDILKDEYNIFSDSNVSITSSNYHSNHESMKQNGNLSALHAPIASMDSLNITSHDNSSTCRMSNGCISIEASDDIESITDKNETTNTGAYHNTSLKSQNDTKLCFNFDDTTTSSDSESESEILRQRRSNNKKYTKTHHQTTTNNNKTVHLNTGAISDRSASSNKNLTHNTSSTSHRNNNNITLSTINSFNFSSNLSDSTISTDDNYSARFSSSESESDVEDEYGFFPMSKNRVGSPLSDSVDGVRSGTQRRADVLVHAVENQTGCVSDSNRKKSRVVRPVGKSRSLGSTPRQRKKKTATKAKLFRQTSLPSRTCIMPCLDCISVSTQDDMDVWYIRHNLTQPTNSCINTNSFPVARETYATDNLNQHNQTVNSYPVACETYPTDNHNQHNQTVNSFPVARETHPTDNHNQHKTVNSFPVAHERHPTDNHNQHKTVHEKQNQCQENQQGLGCDFCPENNNLQNHDLGHEYAEICETADVGCKIAERNFKKETVNTDTGDTAACECDGYCDNVNNDYTICDGEGTNLAANDLGSMNDFNDCYGENFERMTPVDESTSYIYSNTPQSLDFEQTDTVLDCGVAQGMYRNTGGTITNNFPDPLTIGDAQIGLQTHCGSFEGKSSTSTDDVIPDDDDHAHETTEKQLLCDSLSLQNDPKYPASTLTNDSKCPMIQLYGPKVPMSHTSHPESPESHLSVPSPENDHSEFQLFRQISDEYELIPCVTDNLLNTQPEYEPPPDHYDTLLERRNTPNICGAIANAFRNSTNRTKNCSFSPKFSAILQKYKQNGISDVSSKLLRGFSKQNRSSSSNNLHKPNQSSCVHTDSSHGVPLQNFPKVKLSENTDKITKEWNESMTKSDWDNAESSQSSDSDTDTESARNRNVSGASLNLHLPKADAIDSSSDSSEFDHVEDFLNSTEESDADDDDDLETGVVGSHLEGSRHETGVINDSTTDNVPNTTGTLPDSLGDYEQLEAPPEFNHAHDYINNQVNLMDDAVQHDVIENDSDSLSTVSTSNDYPINRMHLDSESSIDSWSPFCEYNRPYVRPYTHDDDNTSSNLSGSFEELRIADNVLNNALRPSVSGIDRQLRHIPATSRPPDYNDLFPSLTTRPSSDLYSSSDLPPSYQEITLGPGVGNTNTGSIQSDVVNQMTQSLPYPRSSPLSHTNNPVMSASVRAPTNATHQQTLGSIRDASVPSYNTADCTNRQIFDSVEDINLPSYTPNVVDRQMSSSDRPVSPYTIVPHQDSPPSRTNPSSIHHSMFTPNADRSTYAPNAHHPIYNTPPNAHHPIYNTPPNMHHSMHHPNTQESIHAPPTMHHSMYASPLTLTRVPNHQNHQSTTHFLSSTTSINPPTFERRSMSYLDGPISYVTSSDSRTPPPPYDQSSGMMLYHTSSVGRSSSGQRRRLAIQRKIRNAASVIQNLFSKTPANQ